MLDINLGTVTSFSFQKPGGKVEKLCTISLRGVGSKNPQMVFKKLWDRKYDHSLPPRSLLLAVGELSRSRGTAPWSGRVNLGRKLGDQVVGCCMEFRVYLYPADRSVLYRGWGKTRTPVRLMGTEEGVPGE